MMHRVAGGDETLQLKTSPTTHDILTCHTNSSDASSTQTTLSQYKTWANLQDIHLFHNFQQYVEITTVRHPQ